MGSEKLKGPLPVEERQETFKKALTTGNISLVEELLDSGESQGMVSNLAQLFQCTGIPCFKRYELAL